MNKSTNRDLALELSQLDQEGELRQIISNCLNNVYHDFKSQLAFPKVELATDLYNLAKDLKRGDIMEVRYRVINGEFDDSADESDLQEMTAWLSDEDAPEVIYDILGLPKPE